MTLDLLWPLWLHVTNPSCHFPDSPTEPALDSFLPLCVITRTGRGVSSENMIEKGKLLGAVRQWLHSSYEHPLGHYPELQLGGCQRHLQMCCPVSMAEAPTIQSPTVMLQPIMYEVKSCLQGASSFENLPTICFHLGQRKGVR